MEAKELRQLMKARRNVYDLLRCFFLQEPGDSFLTALQSKNIFIHLQGLHKELDEGIDLLSSVVFSCDRSAAIPGLLQEYTRLFLGPVPVPLYESVYRSKSGLLMQENTLAVRKKYREARLVINRGIPFPDDHIGAELEFVFYLCQKYLRAKNEAKRNFFLKTQHRFFREHLTAWVSPLCDRLYGEARSPYFKGAAKATKGFVHWDDQENVSRFGVN